jgi:hypothetical protein
VLAALAVQAALRIIFSEDLTDDVDFWLDGSFPDGVSGYTLWAGMQETHDIP